MSTNGDLQLIADRLVDAYDNATMLEPISATVLRVRQRGRLRGARSHRRARRRQGWTPVGRKIGFTNRTIWELFGVDRPMWAHMWSTTVIHAQGDTVVRLDRFVQPRIEPEVVFKLREPPQLTASPSEVLRSVEWMAPGFEIVHCHFPDWKFTVADATADFGVHGALVVGTPLFIDDRQPGRDRGRAFDVRTHAVARRRGRRSWARRQRPRRSGPHARTSRPGTRDQPEHQPLEAGEIITTGTITNMWPISQRRALDLRLRLARTGRAYRLVLITAPMDAGGGTIGAGPEHDADRRILERGDRFGKSGYAWRTRNSRLAG